VTKINGPMNTAKISLSATLLGFGEAGSILSAELVKAGVQSVAAYDVKFGQAEGPAMIARAEAAGVHSAAAPAEAAAGSEIIIAAVTASSSVDAARTAARYIRPDQFYLDLNSVSPGKKREAAQLIEDAGGRFVDVAVMAPVAPYGIKVPMAVGGKWGEAVAARLTPFGFRIEVFEREVGYVSAMKMCRSVMIKGIESLVIEAMTAAYVYDVVDQVIPSLDEYFKGKDWRWQAEYMFGRVVEHGVRRAAEMREAAKTVAEIGLEPLMTAATAERQQWVADHIPPDKFKGREPKLDDYAAAMRAALDRK
jgi:3-hydroxyisobutyrate dehydrogenase-like beta-hydroxyacid dehydrogenase